MVDPLSAVPQSLISGDSLNLSLTDFVADYPASAGWAVALVLAPVAGGTNVSTAASGGAIAWDILITSAASAAFAVGTWRWSITAIKDGNRSTLKGGQIEILADPATNDLDSRTVAKKTLDALDAAILGRASKTELEIEFQDGRRIRHMPHGDLIKMRDVYARKVAAEMRKNRGPIRIMARM